jgi:hypothetical protein
VKRRMELLAGIVLLLGILVAVFGERFGSRAGGSEAYRRKSTS